MGNSLLSRFALPGVHSYTCHVSDHQIEALSGDKIEILTWLHPQDGSSVPYSESSIPLIRAKAKRDETSTVVIIYSHGNAEDVSMTQPWITYLAEHFGVDVLAYDYTGYGTNYNAATNESIHHNALSVMRYVTKHLADYKHIFLYGRSIGTAPALYAATHAETASSVHGVILQSAFCSIVTTRLPMFMQKYIPRFIDMLFNEERLANCTTPVLLIHGKADKVVPFSHALELSKKSAVWSTCFIEGANHNNMETVSLYRSEMSNSISNFIDFVLANKK